MAAAGIGWIMDLFAGTPAGLFTFLGACAPQAPTRLGDARMIRKDEIQPGQNYLLDTSRFAMDAADKAPSLLMKLESLRDIFSADRVAEGGGEGPVGVGEDRGDEGAQRGRGDGGAAREEDFHALSA